jgi:ElaB/YqjD/DUF883 family membrane-anchored ribosome-binding protein
MRQTAGVHVPWAGTPLAGVKPPARCRRIYWREDRHMTASTENLEAAANAVAEDLANDVRGVLASKELDSIPHIKALRQRVDAKLAIARELASEKTKLAAKKAREAAGNANAYAHDEPWQIAGAALAVGLLVGLLLGRRD